MRLKDQVAIVTGAGRGIGVAIAKGLAREGAAVVVNYSRSATEAAEVVRDIHGAGGIAVAVQADVKELADHDRLVSAALGRFVSATIICVPRGLRHRPIYGRALPQDPLAAAAPGFPTPSPDREPAPVKPARAES